LPVLKFPVMKKDSSPSPQGSAIGTCVKPFQVFTTHFLILFDLHTILLYLLYKSVPYSESMTNFTLVRASVHKSELRPYFLREHRNSC
jgi:hypothetical protein